MPYYDRKPTRLKNFDYATENYYFVTICANNKCCIFGRPGDLNAFGKIAKEGFAEMEKHFPTIKVDQCIVMPNHVHAIICIQADENPVSLTTVVGLYKSGVSRKIHRLQPERNVWQRSFHDRVIRNQQEYERIWNYVHYNDQKWEQDCFYIKMEE